MLAHRDAVWGGRQPSHLYLSGRRGCPFLTVLTQGVRNGDELRGDGGLRDTVAKAAAGRDRNAEQRRRGGYRGWADLHRRCHR